MSTPERTMATTSGLAGAGRTAGPAIGTTVAPMIAGGRGFIVGLIFGRGAGEEKGYWKGMAG